MFMLRQIRELHGLTMKQLGEMIGQTESSIGLYESGRRKPNYETLLKLSEVLRCSVDSILGNNFALTNDEQTVLYLFRQFQPERQYVAIEMLSALLKTEKNSSDNGVSEQVI